MKLFDWFKSPEQVMYYCDGCGEDFVRNHLEYISLYDGFFCSKCAKMEGDDDE